LKIFLFVILGRSIDPVAFFSNDKMDMMTTELLSIPPFAKITPLVSSIDIWLPSLLSTTCALISKCSPAEFSSALSFVSNAWMLVFSRILIAK
jgi:hypothetical protein